MALCQCPDRPRCEWNGCTGAADWSIFKPALPRWNEPARFKFMCDPHRRIYHDALTKPMPGLDPPKGASEFWRPSLFDMINLASMEMHRQEAVRKAPMRSPDFAGHLTAGQRQTLAWLRQHRSRS